MSWKFLARATGIQVPTCFLFLLVDQRLLCVSENILFMGRFYQKSHRSVCFLSFPIALCFVRFILFCCGSLLDSFYFTWTNVRQRQDLEATRIKPLIAKVQVSELLTEDEKAQISKWKRGADRMENALLKLDNLIMSFQDF